MVNKNALHLKLTLYHALTIAGNFLTQKEKTDAQFMNFNLMLDTTVMHAYKRYINSFSSSYLLECNVVIASIVRICIL